MPIARTATRTAGKHLTNENPGSNAGVFSSYRWQRAAYIFKSFFALPSKIRARSLSLIGAAFSHFVPSALLM